MHMHATPSLPAQSRSSKHGRGHVKRVRCETSAAMVPKDKAIKRFQVPGRSGLAAAAAVAGSHLLFCHA
jgi:ribosomal protein S26